MRFEVINIDIWEDKHGTVELRTKSPYECVKKLIQAQDRHINELDHLMNEMNRLTIEIEKLGYSASFVYKGLKNKF